MRLPAGTPTTLTVLAAAYSYGPFCSDAAGVSFLALTDGNAGRYHTFSFAKRLTSSAPGIAAFDMVPGPPLGGEAPDLFFSFGGTAQNGIARVARTRLSTTDVVTNAGSPHGIARQGRTIYFSDKRSGAIRRCVLATTASPACEEAPAIASGEDDPRFITTDASAVYWATRRGLLRRAPL